MKHWLKQTILDLWQENWTFVNDNSKSNYDATNEITYNTELLKSSLCDKNDAVVLVRVYITVTTAPETQIAFKKCAPFTKCK